MSGVLQCVSCVGVVPGPDACTTLSCLHLLCARCDNTAAANQTLQCPVCACQVRRISSLVRFLLDSNWKKTNTCSTDHDGPWTAAVQECTDQACIQIQGAPLCRSCATNHTKQRMFKNHHIQSIQALSTEHETQLSGMCPLHNQPISAVLGADQESLHNLSLVCDLCANRQQAKSIQEVAGIVRERLLAQQQSLMHLPAPTALNVHTLQHVAINAKQAIQQHNYTLNVQSSVNALCDQTLPLPDHLTTFCAPFVCGAVTECRERAVGLSDEGLIGCADLQHRYNTAFTQIEAALQQLTQGITPESSASVVSTTPTQPINVQNSNRTVTGAMSVSAHAQLPPSFAQHQAQSAAAVAPFHQQQHTAATPFIQNQTPAVSHSSQRPLHPPAASPVLSGPVHPPPLNIEQFAVKMTGAFAEVLNVLRRCHMRAEHTQLRDMLPAYARGEMPLSRIAQLIRDIGEKMSQDEAVRQAMQPSMTLFASAFLETNDLDVYYRNKLASGELWIIGVKCKVSTTNNGNAQAQAFATNPQIESLLPNVVSAMNGNNNMNQNALVTPPPPILQAQARPPSLPPNNQAAKRGSNEPLSSEPNTKMAGSAAQQQEKVNDTSSDDDSSDEDGHSKPQNMCVLCGSLRMNGLRDYHAMRCSHCMQHFHAEHHLPNFNRIQYAQNNDVTQWQCVLCSGQMNAINAKETDKQTVLKLHQLSTQLLMVDPVCFELVGQAMLKQNRALNNASLSPELYIQFMMNHVRPILLADATLMPKYGTIEQIINAFVTIVK